MSEAKTKVTAMVDTGEYEKMQASDRAMADIIREGVDIALNGNGKSEKRHTKAVYSVTVELSEFECRFIGDRLWQMGEHYAERGDDHSESQCKWFARRFHQECATREKNDVEVAYNDE